MVLLEPKASLPHLYCRSRSEWKARLTGLGFELTSDEMNTGKPFANVMLVCRLPV